jgi:hypothetical protein
MVAYSFKAQFVEPILTGRKHGTIRLVGKRRHARVGDDLQLYAGMRTRQCRLILRARCGLSLPILMRWAETPEIIIDGAKLDPQHFDSFACSDGFTGFEAMARFWRDTHAEVQVFPGQWTKWFPPPGPVEMGADVRPMEKAA